MLVSGKIPVILSVVSIAGKYGYIISQFLGF